MTDRLTPEKYNVALEALRGGLSLGVQAGTVGFVWKLFEQYRKNNWVTSSIEVAPLRNFSFISASIGCALGAIVSGIRSKRMNERLEANQKWAEQHPINDLEVRAQFPQPSQNPSSIKR